MRMMFGGQTDKFDYHYFGWNFEFMNNYLLEAGFKRIERVLGNNARPEPYVL